MTQRLSDIPPDEPTLDMREVAPGCAIDEFHFEVWAGFLNFMLQREEVRAEFEAETGAKFFAPARSGIEAMIDKACGIDRDALGAAYMHKFAAWVTPLYWGGPEGLSPSIVAKLASVDTGPKGEDPQGLSSSGSAVPAERGDAR